MSSRHHAKLLEAHSQHMLEAHNSNRGGRRESAVRDYLRAILPSRFGVAPGEIVAADGSSSPQIDAIVFDRSDGLVFSEFDGTVVVPTESVYAAVEVSTTLDGRKLAIDLAKLAAVKAMPCDAFDERARPPVHLRPTYTWYGRDSPIYPKLALLFAFDSLPVERIAQDVTSDDEPHPLGGSVDAIFSLRKGSVLNAEIDGRVASNFTLRPSPSSSRIAAPSTDDSSVVLQHLTSFLLGDLLQARMTTNIDPMRYVSGGTTAFELGDDD